LIHKLVRVIYVISFCHKVFLLSVELGPHDHLTDLFDKV